MIENIISDYLKDNKRLILPELGAFLKKDDGSVVFVPFLNKDDGVLSSLVKHAYGATQIEANSIISQYTSAIRASIAGNGYYLIKSLGALKSDVNGIIILDPNIRDASKERPSQIITPQPTVAAQAKPIAPTPEPAPKTVEIPVIVETPKVTATAKPVEVQIPKVTEAPQITKRAEIVEPVQPKPIWERDSNHSAASSNRPSPQPTTGGKNKTDMIFIIAIIAAVIAVAAMVYGYFANDLPVFNLSDGEVQTEQVQTPTAQPVQAPAEQPVTK